MELMSPVGHLAAVAVGEKWRRVDSYQRPVDVVEVVENPFSACFEANAQPLAAVWRIVRNDLTCLGNSAVVAVYQLLRHDVDVQVYCRLRRRSQTVVLPSVDVYTAAFLVAQMPGSALADAENAEKALVGSVAPGVSSAVAAASY